MLNKQKTSYGERLLRGFIKKCFPNTEILNNYRGAGIINPDTSQPLEIDIYLPKIKLGFEFNGKQHMTDEAQKHRDKIKRQQCIEKGIVLITIWTASLENGLYEKIKKECEKHGIYNVVKPTAKYIREFNYLAHEYKKNIYKMNQEIKNSKTFVKRRNKKWSKTQ